MQSKAFGKTAHARPFAVFLLTMLISASQGSAQNITLTVTNAPLETVFKEIQKQSPYRFVFTTEQLKEADKVSFSVTQASIDKVMSICLKGQPLNYSIEKNFISIRKKETVPQDPQESVVEGRVLNSGDEPIQGATITNNRSGRKTITDGNGGFTLAGVREKDVLTVSNIGYETKEIQPGKMQHIVLRLAISVSKLDDVQVIAYGTVTKRLNTGASAP